VLSVISAKGGVGKTTTTANLAAALVRYNKDVTAVDGNLTTPNLSIHLGCALYPVTLHDVLAGRASMDQAIYRHPAGFRVVPASLSVGDIGIDPSQLSAAIRELVSRRGLIIVDGAAGLGREARAAMDCADGLLIVTNPDLPAVTDALKAIKLAQMEHKSVLGVVVNRAGAHRSEMPADEIADMLEAPVLSTVSEDRNIPASIAAKVPIVLWKPRSKSARSFRKLAATLVGEAEPEAGFFSNLLGFLRR